MRIKHIISEKERTAFGRGIARGFTATQKGGLLGPDSAEQAIKNFFTKTGNDPKKDKPKPDVKKTKNTVVTKEPVDAKKPTEKGKPAPEPKATEPKAEKPKPGDDFPVGYAGGEKYKVRVGDVVDYTNAKGKERQAKVTKLLQTRDKDGNLQIELSLKGATNALDRKKITKVNGKDWKFTESKEETMSDAIKEGLADLADMAERDHEVQMARADLYKIAKYAIKLHDMMKNITEADGLEGWQQAKITKAADYISSVYHNLDYDLKFSEDVTEARDITERKEVRQLKDPSKEVMVSKNGKTIVIDKDKEKDYLNKGWGLAEAKENATCGCGPECDHCGGKHSMKEVGKTCECCDNKIKTVAAEGKYKNDAQRKAVHAAKAEKKDKYKESLSSKLSSMLEYKKDNNKLKKRKKLKASKATPITTPADIQPDNIQPDKISPNTGGHPTGS